MTSPPDVRLAELVASLSQWFGDDRLIRADSYQVDKVGLPMMRLMVSHLGTGSGPLRPLSIIGRFLAGGYKDAIDGFVAHCQTTGDIAERLSVGADVRRALTQAFERWDGKGVPGDARGTAIEAPMRIVQIADDAEVFTRLGGPPAAMRMLADRRGTEFDPHLVDLVSEDLLADLDEIDAWAAVIDGCAARGRHARNRRCRRRLVCPICFTARRPDGDALLPNAELGATVVLWDWIGPEPATTFSY